jgi:hypothetical protein
VSIFARIQDGIVAELFTPPAGVPIGACFHSALTWVDCTATPAVVPGWTYTGSVFAAPPAPPAPTLAQQASAMLGMGCQIVSACTPALDGTYSCSPATQQNMSSLYNLIQRAGGAAFPAGLTALPFPDAAGGVHIFPTVAGFLAFETAIGNYVLALGLIEVTGTGTLPTQPVTIP